jgi:hypothetical protein
VDELSFTFNFLGWFLRGGSRDFRAEIDGFLWSGCGFWVVERGELHGDFVVGKNFQGF